MTIRKIIAAALAAVMLISLCACGKPKKSEYSADNFTYALWVQRRDNGEYDIDPAVIGEIVRLFNEAECKGYAKWEKDPTIGFGVGLIGETNLTICQYEGNKFYVRGDGDKVYIIESAELCEYVGALNAATK